MSVCLGHLNCTPQQKSVHPTREDLPLPHPLPSSLASKGLLGGVDHVKEAVLVPLLLVDLRDGGGHGHHAVLVDQQEEGLSGVQLEPTPGVGARS